VWAGPLSGNRLAVVLWNRCEESANIIVKLPSVGLDGSSPYSVRDLWKHETLSENVVGTFGAQVDVHDCKMYIFTPAVTVASS
jgi:alpha-galactosidase